MVQSVAELTGLKCTRAIPADKLNALLKYDHHRFYFFLRTQIITSVFLFCLAGCLCNGGINKQELRQGHRTVSTITTFT